MPRQTNLDRFSDYWLSASEEKFVSLSITYIGKDFGYFSWNLGCQKVPFAGDDSAASEECRVLTLEMLDRAIASLHLPDSCEKIRGGARGRRSELLIGTDCTKDVYLEWRICKPFFWPFLPAAKPTGLVEVKNF